MPLSQAACWLFLYFVAGVVSGQFNVYTTALAPYVWLPAGVSLAAMLLSSSRSGVPMALAFALMQTVLSHLGGRDIFSALVLGALAGVAPLIAATVVRTLRVPLEGLHLLEAVLLAAMVSALLLGGGGALFFALTKNMPLMVPLVLWSAAIFVGVCITLPLLTVWTRLRLRRSVRRNEYREWVGYVSFLAMAGLTWWLFDSSTAVWFDAIGATCPLYLPMFCVVLVAIVGGARGGTLAVLTLTLICLGHTAHGQGPFVSKTTPVSISLLQAQLYIGVSAILVLIVHALREAEAQAYAEADRWRTDLELSLSGSALITYTADPATQTVKWRGDVRRLTGHGAEALSTIADVLAHVHPSDRERLRERWSTQNAVADHAPLPLSFRLSCPLVENRWIDLIDVGSPLSDVNGQAAIVAGVWQSQLSLGK